MQRHKAKQWLAGHGLTVAKARSLVDVIETERRSKVNKSLTRAHVKQILLDALTEIEGKKGADYDLATGGIGHRLIAQNILRECM